MHDPDIDKLYASAKRIDNASMCRAIFLRHKDTISVQKLDTAVPRLQAILEAALNLSNRRGFDAMSLRDLCEASGMSIGGLYAYVDGKTMLLKMILTEVTCVVDAVLSNPPEGVTDDPEAYLRWLIDAHLRLTEDLLPWFTFAFMEAKTFPKAERKMAIDSEALTEQHFADAIRDGIARGRFRADTSDLLPALIKPLLQDWYVKRSKYRRRGVTLETYIATVQDMVLTACLPLPQKGQGPVA